MAMMDEAAAAANVVRLWRTAFLSLRDETTTSNSSRRPITIMSETELLIQSHLLHKLIFSQFNLLLTAAPKLSPHEVTSDVILLVELANSVANATTTTATSADTFLHTCRLIHDVSCCVCLQFNSASWALILDFLQSLFTCLSPSPINIINNQLLLPTTSTTTTADTPLFHILHLLRNMVNQYGTKCLVPENTHLLTLLLHIVAFTNSHLLPSPYSSPNAVAHKLHGNNLWEYQILSFTMISDTLSRLGGSSFSPQMWQSTLELLRKVTDSLVSNSFLVEDTVMSRFYTSLLHCLHLVLSDPKGSLSEHVAGFVAALRMFFAYGVTIRSPIAFSDATHKQKKFNHLNRELAESPGPERGAYRPPHLRKREGKSMPSLKATRSQTSVDNESYALGFSSSDSEHSDSDGFGKDMDNLHSSKTRLAAIICIQDLCLADPKAVTAHLTMLLPTNDVLQPRKHEATLMTCLLFDPALKTRMASASALAAMLSGPSSVFLQVAEYKESTKCGSFTALSSSLGQTLMQLHSGILYLVQREVHNGLLASLFKVLILLISATPYARMPEELLPEVISALRLRMINGFPSRTDQSGLMAMLLNCLGAAFSTSPPSLQVQESLQEEISTDLLGVPGKQSLLALIFQYSERATNPTISFEALQVVRAVSHNYPKIMAACWLQVSTLTYGLLRATTAGVSNFESSTRPLKGNVENSVALLGERCIMAAAKVLDECLRAISGFKGTEDVLDDRSLDTPFTSDCTKTKRISSAPSYGLEIDGPESSKRTHTQEFSGSQQWCEAIEKHLPLVMFHSSAMVRAASVTCFAGITSSVFFSLTKENQDFILSSSINAALNDEAPSVRSAACRAIGVISCFPQISRRAEILEKFIHAIETNTRDPLVSVRITASWALANICDLLRHRASDFDLDMCSTDSKTYSRSIALLAESALRLSKDGDKIKSNAVRALGNLSRFVRFTSISTSQYEGILGGPSLKDVLGDPHWLGRMVQAFVSCVTTGNVKVRWNVCHALSNLFLNETLKLEDMAWAPSVFSILLLLLRDSSNFKIRIHAAAALAVPSSRLDYGSSFADVVQGLEHVLETLGSDQVTAPSSFKYRDALEKQVKPMKIDIVDLTCAQPCFMH
ncbi:hypothetical protein AQUCO_03700336v1 [Aquilegia coerulea]|uniref:DUF4042 domain-containing protein n=1 Tax=Aquilegia coerulea TaxID=218851 RepID=A0A2G5CUS5_AQUCA|nr:hypothetical protein AQUCO_03700336v1 [Aquilegia coerulea]